MAVALVINHPVAADRIARTGTPVVYVDSLPYLWAIVSEVPAAVATSCARRSTASALAPASPLHGSTDVSWVEPKVPPPRRRQGGGSVVVSAGGLHSHLVGGASDA
ncbi:hypothetical protein [Streptomyces sp. NPDC017993]|uniref:hypothetical protein n=1 Tax=Streptomyces sp. NPDC017993 TaxID=3365027 RepID=UPI0037BA54E8